MDGKSLWSILWVFVWVAAARAGSPAKPLSPPPGWSVRDVAGFDENIVKAVPSRGSGKLYVLATNGDVWVLDVGTGDKKKLWNGPEYAGGNLTAMGICVDEEGRIYTVTNQLDDSSRPAVNHVRIFRGLPEGKPAVWFKTDYPWGIGTFNHGVSRIGIGPDGWLYVSSGSRTDHGELGNEPNRAAVGEIDGVTGCFWRLDPKEQEPRAEVFARGLRNTFGFCWDEQGVLWGTENGPNAEAPEEINRIVKGGHYGFPYRFAEMPGKLYGDQPSAPPGLVMTGPAAELENHSSPSGIVWLGSEFPAAVRGRFLVGRFGNIIKLPHDVGMDVVAAVKKGEKLQIEPFMKNVGRVTDLVPMGGKIYIVVYDGQTANGEGIFDGGAKVIELAANPSTTEEIRR